MLIQWYGQACFRIQSGDLVIAVDPFAKEIGLTPPRFRANLTLITHSHQDHANFEAIGGEPFLIKSPGEYEIQGIYINGIETFHDTSQGKERGVNTMYKIETEDIKLLHMGDFGEGIVRDDTLDQIGDVDVLMIPVGGTYTIDATSAAKVIKQIEPRFVIPMHYKIPGLKAPLDDVQKFLKEMGVKDADAQEKFTVKKKDIGEDEKTEVIVLTPA